MTTAAQKTKPGFNYKNYFATGEGEGLSGWVLGWVGGCQAPDPSLLLISLGGFGSPCLQGSVCHLFSNTDAALVEYFVPCACMQARRKK